MLLRPECHGLSPVVYFDVSCVPWAQFERLLIVDTAIMDHLPKVYEEALHTLFGDGLKLRSK